MLLAHITHGEHSLLVGLLTLGIFLGMIAATALIQSWMEKRKGAK